MRKQAIILVLLAALLMLAACTPAAPAPEPSAPEPPAITDMNILDENEVEIEADELGTVRTEKCTVEVFFTGAVETIAFFAVTEDESGQLNGEFLASANVDNAQRALYHWELPFGFTGHIWAVLNDDRSVFSEANSRAISSVLEFVAPYVVFSCEYNGAPLQVMLYQPKEKGSHGIWAVESYKDAEGIHPYVYEGNEFIPTEDFMHELNQNAVSILGDDPMYTQPENVAISYLKEILDFEPETFELKNQKDNSYE